MSPPQKHTPPIQHDHLIRHGDKILNEVGADENDMGVRIPVQKPPNFDATYGIKTNRGLVENKHARLHDDRTRNARALPHSTGEFPYRRTAAVGQSHFFDGPFGRSAGR
jgi:hypothetical protein